MQPTDAKPRTRSRRFLKRAATIVVLFALFGVAWVSLALGAFDDLPGLGSHEDQGDGREPGSPSAAR